MKRLRWLYTYYHFRIRYQYGRFLFRLRQIPGECLRFIAWLIAPILWSLPSQRDAYYQYRESCWRKATSAVSFVEWVYLQLRGG